MKNCALIAALCVLAACGGDKETEGSPATCADGVWNPDEEARDCGGPCGPCAADTNEAPALQMQVPEITRVSPLSVSGLATDDRGVPRVRLAGAQVEVIDDAFTADVVLARGQNQIVAGAVDDAGLLTMVTRPVTYDPDPPSLRLDGPFPTITGRALEVTGVARDGLTGVASVTAGDVVAQLDGAAFRVLVPLADGENSVVITATDGAGNQTAQTIAVRSFLSAPLVAESPGGARVEFGEGAIPHPELTVEVRDLSSQNIGRSVGAEDEILAAVPPGGLPGDGIVIPGAMAVTFDGPELPNPAVNIAPSMSVPATMGGLSNDMPLWILQLVPDRDGDGLPEFIVASEARIENGRLVPVAPPEGSALPGFQWGAEFGFSDSAIDQVDGLDHSSITYVACCCGGAFVPVMGTANCQPGPFSHIHEDKARRFAQQVQVLQRELQRARAARQNHLLDNVLGLEGSLTRSLAAGLAALLAVEAAPAIWGSILEPLAVAGGDSLAGLNFFQALRALGGAAFVGANGHDVPSNWAAFLFGQMVGVLKMALEMLADYAIDALQDLNRDVDTFLRHTAGIEAIEAQIADYAERIEGHLGAAHFFSGCTPALTRLSFMARQVADAYRERRGASGPVTTAAGALVPLIQNAASQGPSLTAQIAELDALQDRLLRGVSPEEDIESTTEIFGRVVATSTAVLDARAPIEAAARSFAGEASALRGDDDYATDLLDQTTDAVLALPTSGGHPKAGIAVSFDAFDAHHNALTGADGRWIGFAHVELVAEGNQISFAASTVDVTASLPQLTASTSAESPAQAFPTAGSLDYAVDTGAMTLVMTDLNDPDGDGIESSAEILGGTSADDADTDGDGVDDRTESLGLSDPTDRDSVPSTDPDGDGLETADEQRLSTDPDNPDSDSDGLVDGDEVARGTDPTRPDSDDDGFSDRLELLAGSDPTDATSVPGDDGDGDGLSDAEEAAVAADPSRPDTDGDGLLDGAEVYFHGTRPDRVDSDADGIGDAEEIVLGDDGWVTNPRDWDTDRDGYLDRVEVEAGTDPTDPASRPGPVVEPNPIGCAEPCPEPTRDGGDGVCVPADQCRPGFDEDQSGRCARWIATTGAFPQTSDVVATLLPDGRLLATGGLTTDTFEAARGAWLMRDGVWTVVEPMIVPRSGHALVPLINGEVAAIGGSGGFDSLTAVEVWREGEGWTDAAPMPVARTYMAAMALPDGRVFVAGGLFADENGAVYTRDEDRWDTVTTGLPFVPDVAMAVGDTIMLTGADPDEFAFARRTAFLDPTTLEISMGPTVPIRAPLIVPHATGVLAAGGLGEGFAQSRLAWRLMGDEWAPVMDLPQTIFPSPAGQALAGEVLALRSSAYVYDVARDAWSSTHRPAVNRDRPFMLPLAGNRVIVLGEVAEEPTPAPEIYQRGCR